MDAVLVERHLSSKARRELKLEGTVLLATIDVKNVFNSASWKNMINPLRVKYNTPPTYSKW